MDAKKAQILRNLLFVIGGITMILASIATNVMFWIIGAFILILGCIIDYMFNKCPHCHKNIRLNRGIYCQYCGERLDR